MNTKKACIISLVTFASLYAIAESAYLISTNSSSAVSTNQWGNVANWVDESNTPLTVAPTNGQDIAFGTTLHNEAYLLRTSTGVTVGNDSNAAIANGAVNPKIGTITGGSSRHEIFHAELTTTANQPSRVFNITQAKDFLGFWRVGNGKATFSLNSTAETETEMGSLIISRRPRVAVPTADTKAVIHETTGVGALQKTGSGELEIGVQSSGKDSLLYVSAGTLTLSGNDDETLNSLLSQATFHLDASNTDSLDLSQADEEGYVWVNKWNSLVGNNYASPSTFGGSTDKNKMSFTRPAFMCKTKSPTGLSLVSFGSSPDHKNLGPSNCVLKINSTISDIREAFYVVETPNGAYNATILGGDSTYHYISEGTPFSDYKAATSCAIRQGEIRINGNRKVLQDDLTKDATTELKGCYVMSVASNKGLKFNLLGCDRYFLVRSGGSRLGELIVFTKELTRHERAQINRYLVTKWISGKNLDAKAAVLANGAKIGVKEDRVSTVEELVAPGGTITKTGKGELRAKFLSPASKDINLVVEEGSVKFEASQDDATQATPASSPYLWLDATAENTLTTTQSQYADEGMELVTAWKDCRENVDRAATCPTTSGNYNTENRVAIPSKSSYDGKSVVDFGSTAKYLSHLEFPDWDYSGKQNTYAGFIVVRNLPTVGAPYFGSSSMDFYKQSTRMIAGNYENSKLSCATWTINGEIIDPISESWSSHFTTSVPGFQVFAFQADEPVVCNQLMQDRRYATYPNNCGGAQIGEVIIYHRKITDKERKDTEAYLMRKWLGKEHPNRTQEIKLKSLTLSENSTSTIDSEIPLSIESTKANGETLVKRGEGNASIDVLNITNHFASLEVKGGNLSFLLNFDFSENKLWHFDAMDENSLETTITTDANGNVKTNVIKWLDKRRNGLYCQSAFNDGGNVKTKNCVTDPTLIGSKMPNGKHLPAIDFGLYNTATAAGFFYKEGSSKKTFSNVRELHVVYTKLRYLGNNKYTLVGPYAGDGTGSTYFFHSPYDAILGGSSSANAKNGYVAVNGVQLAYNTELTKGQFHLISLSPTANGTVNAIAIDRNTGAGGGRMCETIGFSKPLGDVQRKFLQDYLRAKWLGQEIPSWNVDTLSVANGSSLTINSDGIPLKVNTFTGGGTITAPNGINGISDINLEFKDADNYDKLEVNGPLTFADEVNLTITATSPKFMTSGTYPIVLSSGDLSNVDLTKWTFTTSNFPANLKATIAKSNGKIVLRLSDVGTCIFIR